MDIKNLETFVMVNEMKSFTQAAARLGFTQSTVSFQIKQLEKELSMPLFERINHTVLLTNGGEKLLPIAQHMLRLAAEASHISTEAEPEGIIRIAIAESLAGWQFNTRFKDFHRRYPKIRLKITSASTDQMFQLLSENRADIVYTLDRRILNHHYITAFEAPVQINFAAAASHPLAGKKKVGIGQILDYPLILTEKDMSYRALLDETLAETGRETLPVLESGDTHLICRLLTQDIGISYLPEFVISEYVQDGRLAILDVPKIHTDVWRQLLYSRRKWMSPELQAVIEFLKE